MENNFNLRKFLTENKLTVNSKQLKEEEQNTFFKATVKKETANPQDGKAAPYGSGYKKVTKQDIKNLVVGMIYETKSKLVTLGYNLDVIQDLVDHLQSNYKEGEDFVLHIGRGDDLPNAITFPKGEFRDDYDLSDMLNAAQSDEDMYEAQGKEVLMEKDEVLKIISEASYFDSYDSKAAKEVGKQLTSIVDIFTKSAEDEEKEIMDAIAKAEQQTGTEVSRFEKRMLLKHAGWIRTYAYRMER